MPHINDLSQNVVWEGNNGEKWIIAESLSSTDELDVKLKRLKVDEKLEEII